MITKQIVNDSPFIKKIDEIITILEMRSNSWDVTKIEPLNKIIGDAAIIMIVYTQYKHIVEKHRAIIIIIIYVL